MPNKLSSPCHGPIFIEGLEEGTVLPFYDFSCLYDGNLCTKLLRNEYFSSAQTVSSQDLREILQG